MVEYIADTHTYLVDGILVPSVTQLLKFKFTDKYKGVPESVLNDKAEYGTKVHALIELLNKSSDKENIIKAVNEVDYVIASALGQYLTLYEKNMFIVTSQEKIVYNEHVAGRYDMLAGVNGIESLLDIKTTATMDKEYLSWQLSLYNYLGKIRAKKLYAIWLPKKELGKLIEIDFKTDTEIEQLINEYEEVQNGL